MPLSNWQATGLFFLRLLTGGMLIYHGWEVFDASAMNVYSDWNVFRQLPIPELFIYFGKTAELLSGIFLFVGLYTRTAAFCVTLIMLYICFFVGNGKFYYEDQHPFLFALLGLVFFFIGPVQWSLDQNKF